MSKVTIKAEIDENITQNGNHEITGPVLNGILKDMVDEMMTSNYKYAGVAALDTDPETPSENVFYIATEVGEYENFLDSSENVLSVAEGEVAIFKFNGTSWSKEVTGIVSMDDINNLSDKIKEIFWGLYVSPYIDQFSQIGAFGSNESLSFNSNNVFLGQSLNGVAIHASTDTNIDLYKFNVDDNTYETLVNGIALRQGWNVYKIDLTLAENETIAVKGEEISYGSITSVNGLKGYNLSSGTIASYPGAVLAFFPLTSSINDIATKIKELYGMTTIESLLGTFGDVGTYSTTEDLVYNSNPQYLGLHWRGISIYSSGNGDIDLYKINTDNRTNVFLGSYAVSTGNNYIDIDVNCANNETIGILPRVDVIYGTNNYPGFIRFDKNTREIKSTFPTYTLKYSPAFGVKDIVENILPTNINWSIPYRIYAVVGQEKSIYLDNIVNRNDDAPEYVIEVNKTFGNVDLRRFYFTPTTTGTKSIYLTAFKGNEPIQTREVKIEILPNTIESSKVIMCVGDSITEARNMPYYVQQAFANVLSSQSIQPTFVGTKGGESGMGGKPTKHEGYYGKSYQWLATSPDSPFWNSSLNRIDIASYRSRNNIPQIDVVSLAMGFNATYTKELADDSFNALQTLIAAFRADNPNTKFVIHLVTYPAMGNVLQENEEMRIDKKNSLYYFRTLCMDAYNDNHDTAIKIGDLGLVYDRWFAYVRENVHPASYYTDDTIQVVTDRVHPSEKGCQQMGEGIMASILKQCF